MLGNIYTDQVCPVCGAKFVDMGPKYGFRCPAHKEVQPTRVRAEINRLKKRFSGPACYELAHQWLGTIRGKIGDPAAHGSFDRRDYSRKKPLGFSNLADQFLAKKAGKVSPAQLRNLTNYLTKAKSAWGDCNIKDIGYAEIEDFLDGLKVSSKTRHNYRSGLHSFFIWACKRYSNANVKINMPEFPEGSFELAYRKITDKVTQFEILAQIKKDRADEPRIWIAIQWLCTYAALRPDDIRRIREEDIDRNNGIVTITRPTKRKKSRQIILIPDDLDLLNSLSRGLPTMPVFRHEKKWSGIRPGEPIGNSLLRKVWAAACDRLGIEGVSLYAGTRHTTVTALQEHATPDQIRQFTQHETSQAFERYIFPDQAHQLEMATLASRSKQTGKTVKMRRKNKVE